MALPRTHLLAIAGAVLSLMSFMAMRTIAAGGGEDFSFPAPAAQLGTQPAGGSGNAPGAKPAKIKEPPPPRVEDVPAPVADALQDGKVVVLLFVEPGSAEDDAVAKNFGAISGLEGVKGFRANIVNVGNYAGIVANLGITQSPAVVIVRPDLKAVPPIEGYVDSGYLRQRVKDQVR